MRSVSLCTRFSIRSQMRDRAPGYLCPQKPVNFYNLRQPRQAAQSRSFPAKHRRLRPVSRPFARVFLQRFLQDCGKVHVCVLCFIVQQRRDRQCFLIPAKSRWSIRHSKVGLRLRIPHESAAARSVLLHQSDHFCWIPSAGQSPTFIETRAFYDSFCAVTRKAELLICL